MYKDTIWYNSYQPKYTISMFSVLPNSGYKSFITKDSF